MVQADHISVTHGSLTVDVPRKIFRGPECRLDEEAARPFRELVRGRYPWLSENSVDVLLRKAQMEMVRVRDEETKGRDHSKTLAKKGKLEQALKHMELHLEMDPEDADSWYEYGNLLCQAGRNEEGFKAFNKGRSLFKTCQKSPQTKR